MPERTLIARMQEDPENPGTWLVRSPAVALADDVSESGMFLNPYGAVASLRVLGRTHVLRLPREVRGWVVKAYIGNELTPVAFDDPLVRIDPRMAGTAGEAGLTGEGTATVGAPAGSQASSSSDAELGRSIVVKAPTEGIFYRRSSPDSPAFVEIGSKVASGTVLGLVEVMKCFNQITYGGPGLPASGEVVRILAEDASEVRFGQPLFWIRPG